MIVPYVAFFAPACVLILVLIWREAARQGFSGERVAAAMAACAAGAVIGSKLLMFDFHAPTYGEKTFLGAVAGGMLTLAIVVRVLRFDARAFDVPVLPMLWGAALGRIGCLFAGCCHGLPTTLPWGIRYPETPVAVHPTQFYEAALDVALVLLLARHRARFRRHGSLALAAGAGIAAIRFLVDPLRASSVISGPLTTVQWTTLAVMLAAGAAFVLRERGPRVAAIPPAAPRDTRALRAPMIVLALVAFLMLAGDWFTPMEQMLLGATIFAAGVVVFRAPLPLLARTSPLIGAAMFIPLQVQDPGPDSTRRYFAVGGGGMVGGYEVTTEDCEGNTISRTPHNYGVAAVTAELREDVRRGEGKGLTITGFSGVDRSPNENDPFGGPPTRRDVIQGASIMATIDAAPAGLSIGLATGRWYYSNDDTRFDEGSPKQAFPIVGLRLGSMTRRYGEVMIGTGFPSPAPASMFRAGLAFPDSTGRRTFRLGLSDGGAYVGGRLLNQQGFEFEPFVFFGGPQLYQAGLGVKKRFYFKPRTP